LELALAEDVEVEVGDALATVAADVRDDAVTVAQTQVRGYFAKEHHIPAQPSSSRVSRGFTA
jgi:hypothetical protein